MVCMTSRIHILDTPFAMRGVLPMFGAKWDAKYKAFVYIGDELPATLKPFASKDFSWERWREDDINGFVKPCSPGKVMFTPRDHQMIAGRHIDKFVQAGFRGFIEADEVGTGKTISILLGAYAVAKRRGFTAKKPAYLLIMCPKSAMAHWRNTIRSLNFTSIFRVVVINYDRANKLLKEPASAKNAKRTRTKNKRIASQGNPLVKWDILVADEAHKLKNYQTAQRSKAFARIARYDEPAKTAPFVIWASATIGQNPVEMGYVAPLVGQFVGKSLTLDKWGTWLDANGFHVTKGKVGWSWIRPNFERTNKAEVAAKQQSDIKKMRQILFSPKFPSIRRLPEDIKGFPSVQRIPVPIDLTSEQFTLYQQVWTTFREFLRMNKKGRDSNSNLVQQLRFRQKSSLLIAEGIVDFAMDMLENGQQVAICAEFIESIDYLHEAFAKKGVKVAEVSGRLNEAEREVERLRFQKGEATVMLYTIIEAISFHANEMLPDGTKATSARRANIMMDIRYSAIDCAQIEGRTHRDGEKSNIYYMYANNTVQEKIIKTTIERMKNMRDMSGDKDDLVDEIENMLELEAERDDTPALL